MTARKTKPWRKANPKPKETQGKLTAGQKTRARKKAKAAGRPYPNLVDNMAVAKEG